MKRIDAPLLKARWTGEYYGRKRYYELKGFQRFIGPVLLLARIRIFLIIRCRDKEKTPCMTTEKRWAGPSS
ncbi:MAG: hypothetical protein GXP63_03770 [DPANN group archaeon]|nr:hypothetical protein [DPANN group archaeon]